MIIDKVIIQNYRQYRDVEIDFAKEDNKNFTIIKGNNGAGKTTLLNSLSWCLYGNEIHDYGDDAYMNYCNNKTAHLANNGDLIEVKVRIEFIDDGDPLIFERKMHYKKINGRLEEEPKHDKFLVTKKDGRNMVTIEDDEYTIMRKMPQNIEDYFFFDGARLSEYFQKHKTSKIQEAVFSLSQLDLFKNVSEHLRNVKETYIADQKKLRPKLGNVQSQIDGYEHNIENAKERLKKADENVKDLKEKIKKIDNELISKKATDLEDLAKRNVKLENLIERNRNKLEKLEKQHNKHVLTGLPYVYAYNYFNNFLEVGEISREKGFIPPRFKKSFIKDLLDEGRCICGSDVSIDNEFRKELEKLLETTNPLTDSAEEITVALNQVKEVILKTVKEYKNTSLEYHDKILEVESLIDEFTEEKKEINVRLNNITEIRDLKQRRDKYSKERDNNLKVISNSKSEIERRTDKLKIARQKLNQELKAHKDYDDLTKKINFCSAQADAAKELYSSLKEEMRGKIQELTKEKFVKIQWKEDEFVDIELDEDYDVFITNRLGEKERPGDLSDGEKLCLGLCFMAALHNIAGLDLPIIMDTPLGNLDVDMRHNIAEFLPEFIEGKQTVLLVTGTEYTEDFRNTLYDSVGKEYEINWNNSEEGKESKVVLL